MLLHILEKSQLNATNVSMPQLNRVSECFEETFENSQRRKDKQRQPVQISNILIVFQKVPENIFNLRKSLEYKYEYKYYLILKIPGIQIRILFGF